MKDWQIYAITVAAMFATVAVIGAAGQSANAVLWSAICLLSMALNGFLWARLNQELGRKRT